ncbi:MAG: hypothetical protein ABH844_02465 [Candidatus Omnitrophota bacterium]
MMVIEKAIFVLALICVIGRSQVYAQPEIPRNKIPNEIAVEVRETIENLYSRNPKVRQSASVKLRDMGEKALDAIPFLEGMLDERLY